MTRTEMKNFLDIKAGAVRASYITIAPGQEATYLLKSAQALSYVTANYVGPVPSLVQSEMTAVGDAAPAACARILAEEAQWVVLAGMIETVRRSAKVQITNAATDESALVVFHACVGQLTAMIPGA